jgi:hypothetical protein
MPKITAKFAWRLDRAHSLILLGPMFAFTPPAAPETTPRPCPHCSSSEAIALYETAHTTYFRCIGCQQIWTISRTESSTAPAVA